MKLTADLLSNSVSQINALGDRELVLRGMVISTRVYIYMCVCVMLV